MIFKFFIEMRKNKYNFKEFKEFCDRLKVILNVRKQKKLVIEVHETYVRALKNYEALVSYGIDVIGDVDKCSDVIDEKGKKYFKKAINKEFKTAFIEALDLKRAQESERTLQINKKVKQILEWEYK